MEAKSRNMHKAIQLNELLIGNKVALRLATEADCTVSYLNWLNNSNINRYLETRWYAQDLNSIRHFVISMLHDPDNYLFAIIENASQTHIGNIKLGPINHHHLYADISYFIGEESAWGKGYATQAIQLITQFAFERLNLHRLQAGLYESNKGSGRALQKAGYKLEAIFRNQLRLESSWEDHHWYAILNVM